MKNKWRLFLLVGLTLVLTGSLIGCAKSYTQEDLDAAHIEGRNAGLIEGHAAGKTEGYDVGYAEGKDAGLAELESELASTQQTLAKTQEELEDAEAELLLSNIKVTNLSISSGYVEPGEKVTISATVTNSGGIQISYPAILRINGSEAETKSVVLNAGESQVVSFTVANWSADKYTVELGGLVGTYTVVDPQVIEDLAYITVGAGSYTDDADPEAEGIRLFIRFYDSKSETIEFQDIPVVVTIELYGYRNTFDYNRRQNRELVYKEQTTIDYSTRLSLGAEIKIPFEKIAVNQNRYIKWGAIEVTVTTPNQGDFQDSSDLVLLYDEK